ncbi:hypothetical protein AURDEDRAFT_163420 [Auricularia subglabra TFB-10046 SS5]|nr:hypothetical protein AURDEDRAFT_163420 [Auricularia subglabra TFB-10046 SS5]
MSLAVALAAGGRAADIAGEGTSQIVLGTADLISSSAHRVRFNRDLARTLAQRLREVAVVIQAGNNNESATVFESLLRDAEELLQRQERRNYLAQILHRDRDLRDLQDLNDRLDLALALRKTQSDLLGLAQHPGLPARKLAQELEKFQPHVGARTTSRLPPRPQCCFGREAQTQSISASVTAGGHVAILGGPGIGKTTLALAVLHCPDVTARFGSRRFFAACDAISGQVSCLRTVAEAVGIVCALRTDIRKPLRAALSAESALLVLDNFESVWEPEVSRSDAEELLYFLSEIPTLSVIVTLRGSERPHGLPWARPFLPVMEPLDTRAAMQLVATISGLDSVSQNHTALITAQENHPLALVLLANLAQTEPANALLDRWSEHKTAILRRGAGDDRWTSLDIALETSLSSPRMQAVPDVLLLLGLLALLPNGAAEADIRLWGADIGNKSLSALIRNSLAYRPDGDAQRVRVLAPIRNYMLGYHPPSGDRAASLCAHYFGLAHAATQTTERHSADVDSAGNIDLDNIACVIRYALRQEISIDAAIVATLALCTIFVRSGLGAGPDLLPEALRVSRLQGMQKLTADLLCQWAKISFLTHRQGHPVSLLGEARTIYEQIRDTTGAFDASLELVDFLPPPDAIAATVRLQSDALACADSKRLAACQFKLARAYSGAGNAPDAVKWHEKTLSLLLSASDVDCRAVAMNLQYLADVFLEMGDFATALLKLEDSLLYAKRANDDEGRAITHSILGWIYSDQGHFYKSIENYKHAVAAFGPGSARNTANCHLYLTRAYLAVGDEEAALVSISSAEQLCVAEGDVPMCQVPILRALAEYAIFRGDFDEARAALSVARDECRRADAGDAPPVARMIAET